MASSSSSIRSSACQSAVVEPSDSHHVSVDLQSGTPAVVVEGSRLSVSKTSPPSSGGVVRVMAAASFLVALAAVGCLYSSVRWQAELGLIRAEVASQDARHARDMENLQGEVARHAARLAELELAAKKHCSTPPETSPAEAKVAVLREPEADVGTSLSTVARDQENNYRRLGEELEAAERRRLSVYMNIKAVAAMEKNTGCVTVDLSGGNVALALNTLACNSRHCPSCFIVTNAHASNTLSLTGCSSAYVSATHKIGTTTGWDNSVITLTIINSDSANAAIISDGTNTGKVSALSAAEALCWTHANNALFFPSRHFKDLTVAGAGTVGTTLGVDGAATFNGAMTLGDASTDAILLKGDTTADGTTNPKFDLSSSTGIFKTSTGATTVGGATTFSSSASMEGAVTLGNQKADTITFKGDVASDGTENPDFDLSASSGTFSSSTGANTIGGAATLSGNAQIDGNVDIRGTTILGNEKADTITVKGDMQSFATTNPQVDLSQSTGIFKTSTGNNIFSGAVSTLSTAALTGGAVTLGGLKAHGVLIKGSVSADGTQKPDFDFSLSNTGTFTTSGGSNTIGGAATFSSNVQIDGNVDVQGTTTLGNQAADTVTIKGNVAADATTDPNIDFSGSAGNFLTPTGTSTIGGAATLSSTVTISDVLTLNAAATLGAVKADQIKFKGDVKADGTTNNNIDFSASSGIFKGTTGNGFFGGAMTFQSTASFQDAVTLGNEKGDAILFKGDVTADGTANPDINFAGSSGSFGMTSGAITIAGATTFSSNLAVTGTLSANGAVTLGDAKADSILIKGDVTADGTENPVIDLSGSSGAFTATAGLTTATSFAVSGTTSLNGAVTLGDAKADAILFKGDVTTSAATDPDIDFSASGGQCTFNQGTCSR